ncbi:alpha/beta fold hydrolase [Paenibacillus endoradicis]|uniref:alpha/beta fold hydrolase n=1 Tax=Paenibacillus endoradicis TaxID=2972487 RepID=UPI002159A68A|nr:alpha/beta hydrolase [Paenibacillus endoradicis]MCR8659066.1 alpha/beta hydrolase [Paenibacillus endoradicis]
MTMHYQEHGDDKAPLILFLHGGGVSNWMWDQQTQYFTDYHVVVPDLPEQGLSSNERNFSIVYSAEQLLKLIIEKGTGKKVIIIGFSLGAQIVVQMLSMQPQLIDYAIINSALVRPNRLAKSLIKPSIRLSYSLIRNRFFSRLQAKTLYVSNDYFEQYYRESCQMKLETLVRILEENMSFAIPEQFHLATSKILVTVGAKENSMMKNSAVDLIKNNINCRGLIIPNMGHGLPLANPSFFNQMVKDWIEEEKLPENCKAIH